MVPYGPKQFCMVLYCPMCSCMVPYGLVWSPIVLFCPVWSWIFMYGYELSGMVVYAPLWSPMVMFGLWHFKFPYCSIMSCKVSNSRRYWKLCVLVIISINDLNKSSQGVFFFFCFVFELKNAILLLLWDQIDSFPFPWEDYVIFVWSLMIPYDPVWSLKF